MVQNLTRPVELILASQDVPKTSLLCAWNCPGDGNYEDAGQPAAGLRFMKPVRLTEKNNRGHVCLREDLGRDLFIALPEELHKKLPTLLTDPDFLAARNKLLDAIRRAHSGRKCAAEGIWGRAARPLRKPGTNEETINGSRAIDGGGAIVAQNLALPFIHAGGGHEEGHESASSETPALVLPPIRAVPVEVMWGSHHPSGMRATSTFNFDDH